MSSPLVDILIASLQRHLSPERHVKSTMFIGSNSATDRGLQMMMTEYVCTVNCFLQELEARRFPRIGAPRPGIRELVSTICDSFSPSTEFTGGYNISLQIYLCIYTSHPIKNTATIVPRQQITQVLISFSHLAPSILIWISFFLYLFYQPSARQSQRLQRS